MLIFRFFYTYKHRLCLIKLKLIKIINMIKFITKTINAFIGKPPYNVTNNLQKVLRIKQT